MVVMDPSAIVIYLWLEQGMQKVKCLEEYVVWAVGPESITYIVKENFSKTIGKKLEEGIPKNASEHVPIKDGFSRDPDKIFNLLISSMLNSEIELCGLPSLCD